MLLLDTCTLLWLADNQARLSPLALRVILASLGSVFISAISGFEVAQKYAKGKLILPLPPVEWMKAAVRLHDLQVLPLEMSTALAAGALPPLHADPFDRLLVASAQTRGLTLLTPDPLIRQYPALTTLW